MSTSFLPTSIVSFFIYSINVTHKADGLCDEKEIHWKSQHCNVHTPHFNQVLHILQNINVLDSDIQFFRCFWELRSKYRVYTYIHPHIHSSFKHRQLCVALAYRINLMVDFFPAHSPVHDIHKLEFYCIHLFICWTTAGKREWEMDEDFIAIATEDQPKKNINRPCWYSNSPTVHQPSNNIPNTLKHPKKRYEKLIRLYCLDRGSTYTIITHIYCLCECAIWSGCAKNSRYFLPKYLQRATFARTHTHTIHVRSSTMLSIKLQTEKIIKLMLFHQAHSHLMFNHQMELYFAFCYWKLRLSSNKGFSTHFKWPQRITKMIRGQRRAEPNRSNSALPTV